MCKVCGKPLLLGIMAGVQILLAIVVFVGFFVTVNGSSLFDPNVTGSFDLDSMVFAIAIGSMLCCSGMAAIAASALTNFKLTVMFLACQSITILVVIASLVIAVLGMGASDVALNTMLSASIIPLGFLILMTIISLVFGIARARGSGEDEDEFGYSLEFTSA